MSFEQNGLVISSETNYRLGVQVIRQNDDGSAHRFHCQKWHHKMECQSRHPKLQDVAYDSDTSLHESFGDPSTCTFNFRSCFLFTLNLQPDSLGHTQYGLASYNEPLDSDTEILADIDKIEYWNYSFVEPPTSSHSSSGATDQ